MDLLGALTLRTNIALLLSHNASHQFTVTFNTLRMPVMFAHRAKNVTYIYTYMYIQHPNRQSVIILLVLKVLGDKVMDIRNITR